MKILLQWPGNNPQAVDFWLPLWSAPDNPHRENQAFLQPWVCAGHIPHRHLVLYCCSCPLPQEGKVLSMNFHTSWPVAFFSWRCCGGQESRKAVTSSLVSLEGFLSWNDLSMANCSNSACPNKARLHESPRSDPPCLFGRRWAGRRLGAVVPPLVLSPWGGLCAGGPAGGWVSSPSAPTPSHHLTNSSASGNLVEEVCCLTEQAWWACFTLPCLFKAFWISDSSDTLLFYIRCELFRDVCNQPDFPIIWVGENMRGCFPKSPTLLKVHEKEIFWAW